MDHLTRITLATALCLAACGSEPEAVKTPEQVQQERAAALEAAKQGPLGAQLKTLDKAAAVQDTLDAAREARDAEIDAATDDPPEAAADDGND